ncbi:DUF892 family protein [Variovorax sp. J22P271]|uniref:DUF892 family protein n=1 Tax=Variovorax davisae TaxID=3053515 RepID=UPI00257840E9|nr:DUF892 family protein [Variovorax sp. J22P271]MDM0032282.1 DUF892 family protein [Variovorax sp. J22P271]
MSTPSSLKDLYTDELKDLWSANDQMLRFLKKVEGKATDESLKEMLSNSQEGIAEHTELLKELLTSNGEEVAKEHCKGMAGLTAEAIKHTMEEAPEEGAVLDAVIISQFQRMTHYGIAGFGTAAAYAQALGQDDDYQTLKGAVEDMYGGDEYMSKLAETTVNIKAGDE